MSALGFFDCLICDQRVRQTETNAVVYLDYGYGPVREGLVHRRLCADKLAKQYMVKIEALPPPEENGEAT